MLAENPLGVEEKEKQNDSTGGFKSAEEILSVLEPVSRGNADATALISTQPLLATAPPEEATQEAAAFQKPLLDDQQITCPQCGLLVPDHRLQPAHQLKNSKHGSKRSKSGKSGSHESAAAPADYCFHLLLACLWCEFSVLLLGLMEACSSCLQGLCSSCCHACARCCSAIQDTPVEEFNCHTHCHSVLFESCCEPTECLEFCLECCEICHRS
ncbi:myoD family inhibitor domain-containing protein isoform X2 [Oryzias latipes]|uniref:myoD family inhibitor domain-containing protein isoform X2 n=1 Tax=Oryzias latipes TaxID=8090 RepID=UPI0005CC34F2|nr:myoD family inhibitor domain-containing protein isoform X2 [Oryzias latipes]